MNFIENEKGEGFDMNIVFNKLGDFHVAEIKLSVKRECLKA